MKDKARFDAAVARIRERSARPCPYAPEAFAFIYQAIEATSAELAHDGQKGHMSAEQVYKGCIEYALLQFGPLADSVFQQWGIHESSDVGNIVYLLIEERILSKQKDDQLEQFEGFEPPALFIDRYFA